MKPLQRYETVTFENWSRDNEYLDSYTEHKPSDNGDWVRDEDVKKLESLNEEMFAIIKSLVVNRRLIGDPHFEGFRERLIDMEETIVNKVEGEKE